MKTFNSAVDALDYSLNNPLEVVEFKSYDRNGKLWQHRFYLNGKRHGEYKLYYQNGQLHTHYFYVDGELHGESKSYYRSGKLRYHCFYANDEDINLDHLRDGSYKSLCIKHTLFNGNLIDEDI